jgi:C4-dicarboxylate-specific signal transduction histidine kinase
MLLNARALVRAADRPDLILLAIDDITETRQIESTLRETEAGKQAEVQVRHRQVQLAHALRISTVGELASGLAHELNQPLSAFANSVEACSRFIKTGKVDLARLLELLNDASAEALRAGDIVQHLRQFIRKGQPQFERSDLIEILSHLPRMLAHEIEREQIGLRLNLNSQSLPIYADRIQIEQVVVNLLQNAIDSVRGASGDNRDIELAARITEELVEVSVRDKGAGISDSATHRLFEPFFTTKARGLGLGLAISRSIIEAHHGRIWAEKPADGGPGVTVFFTLPLHEASPSQSEGTK